MNRFVEDVRANGETSNLERDRHVGCGIYGPDTEVSNQDNIKESEFFDFNYIT